MARKRKEVSKAETTSKAQAVTTKGGRKKKVEQEPEPHAVVEEPENHVKKPRIVKEAPVLQSVSHPTHGQTPGDIFVWGNGDCGQIGMGEDVPEKLRPYLLNVNDKKVVQVCCGGMHTVVLLEDGPVWTWGVNDEGALGRNTGGEHWDQSNLSKNDYPFAAAEFPGQVRLPPDAGRIVQAAAGDSHTVVLTELGSVYGWGTYRDHSGVMGFSPSVRIQLTATLIYGATKPEEQVVQIASGTDHTVALTAAGKVLSWGNGEQGQLGRLGERVSSRARLHTLLTPAVVTFRRKRGLGTKVKEVACGSYSTFAVTTDGNVFACGLNQYGQLGLADLTPQFAKVHVPLLADIAHITGGEHHSLAVTNQGRLLSFGRPAYGRLGQEAADVNSDDALFEPRPVDGLEGVRVDGLAAGTAVSGCFSDTGDMWCWGFNTNYQVGKGDDDEDEPLPRHVEDSKSFRRQRVLQLQFGGQHAACLAVAREVQEAGQQ